MENLLTYNPTWQHRRIGLTGIRCMVAVASSA